MINFPASTFTWFAHPCQPDPHYKYLGGFVGEYGQAYHVRFNLEAKCEITDDSNSRTTEVFLGSPCRSEYTIAKRNLFQIPSGEWRMVFNREYQMDISSRPSWEEHSGSKVKLSESFHDHKIDIRHFDGVLELSDARQVVEATLANDFLNARSTYKDKERGLTVTVEYPVNLINLNAADSEFQVCTGPILLPNLATWDGSEVSSVFVAEVAITSFDWVEFILRRTVEAAEHEKEWLDKPRCRDRHELIDPDNPPPGYPPARPSPTVYNEVWEFDAANVFLRTPNPFKGE